MNKLFIFGLMIFLALAFPVHASLTLRYNQTQNTAGQAVFNTTFSAGGNQTFYVNIPKNATVSNAKLNLSGYFGGSLSTAQTSSSGTKAIGYLSQEVANRFNFSNTTLINNILVYVYKIGSPPNNLTIRLMSDNAGKPTGSVIALCQYSAAQITTTMWINCSGSWNLNANTNYWVRLNTSGADGSNYYTWYWTSTILIDGSVESYSPDGTSWTNEYDKGMLLNLTYQTYPINPYLDVANDGDSQWSFSGTFNQSNNQTSDFSSEINSYLKTCAPYIDGTCDVPFILHSDSAGIMQTQLNTTITYDSQTYDANVTEGQNTTFWVRVNSTSDITDVNAWLVWNGTSYANTTKSQNGTYWTFTRVFTPPSATANSNISFYWNFTYVNVTNTYTQNFSSSYQMLYPFSVTNCTAGTIALNFTSFDEENVSKQLNFSMDLSMSYWLSGSTKNFSYSYIGNNTYYACIIPSAVSLYTDAVIKYWATNYATRYYYLNDYPISNTTSNIQMYFLNSSNGQNVLFTTYNNQNFAVAGVIVTIRRLVGSAWIIAANGITDTTGAYTFFLNPFTTYQITFISSYGTKMINLIPVLTSYTIYIDMTFVEKPSYWDYYKQLNGVCSFDNTTRLLTCTWNDASGHLQNAYLQVIRVNNSASSILCDNTSSSAIGTFVCNFGTPNNNTFGWNLYGHFASYPTKILLDSGSWTDWAAAVTYGAMGLFITFFILLFSGLLGIQMGNPAAVLLLSGVGVGFSMILGFLTFSASATTMILGLFVALGVEIYKLRSER